MTTPDRLHTGEAASTDSSGVEDLVEEGSTDYDTDYVTHLADYSY